MRTKILYEDADILVAHKPAGMATQAAGVRQVDVVSELKTYLAKKEKKEPYLALIHRLDQPVEGLLVFGKNKAAAAKLSEQVARRQVKKRYTAQVLVTEEAWKKHVVSEEVGKKQRVSDGICGDWDEACENTEKECSGENRDQVTDAVGWTETLENYLCKDAGSNTSAVVEKEAPGAKFARLHYEVIKTEPYMAQDDHGNKTIEDSNEKSEETPISAEPSMPQQCIATLRIDLDTGRHHQIRVQLAQAGMPLLGDTKYGTPESIQLSKELQIGTVALVADELSFVHPGTKQVMHFSL